MARRSEIFRRLSGVETPVSEALARLSSMWGASSESDDEEGTPPSEYRASRMTMILHLGFECSPEQAEDVYHTVLDFSGQYPCRIIALCARPESEDAEGDMACKIYSQCYIGASQNEMNCCEALIFEYALGDRGHLENQISNFVETDLPAYYWPYKFGSPERLSDYQFFFKQAERVVFDSAQERFRPDQIKLEHPEKISDLAYARLLPIRQCMGQFLSSFPAEQLVDGLGKVELTSGPGFEAEGRRLLGWIEAAVKDCAELGESPEAEVEFSHRILDASEGRPRVVFEYNKGNSVQCALDLEKGEAKIEATFGGEKHSQTASVGLLDDGKALAEALFFP